MSPDSVNGPVSNSFDANVTSATMMLGDKNAVLMMFIPNAIPDKVVSVRNEIRANTLQSIAIKTPTTGMKIDSPANITATMARAFKGTSLWIGITLTVIKGPHNGARRAIRYSREFNHLVVVADHTKSLYEDEWIDDVIWLAGTGARGDQQLIGENSRLASQADKNFPVHLFEVFKKNRYVYIGEVELQAAPEIASQPDIEGKPRNVLLFPLRLKSESQKPIPSSIDISKLQADKERRSEKIPTDVLKKRAQASGRKKPAQRTSSTVQYARSPDVVAFTKRHANGICDLCGRRGPFRAKKRWYLECHHIVHLAKGGPDTITNTSALCPNCHRKMHILDHKPDREKLQKVAQDRALIID